MFKYARRSKGVVPGTNMNFLMYVYDFGQGKEIPAAAQAPAPILFSLEETDFARLPNSHRSSLRWPCTGPCPCPGDLEEMQEQ